MLTRLPLVQKHLTLTGHLYNAGIVAMFKSAYERLSPDDRSAFIEAAQRAGLATRRKIDELEANGLTQLRNSGSEIIRGVDRGAFQRALQPLIEELRRRFGGELIERIHDTKSASDEIVIGECRWAQALRLLSFTLNNLAPTYSPSLTR